MNTFLTAFAGFIEWFAECGAGFMSAGSSYQPNIPEELQ